MSTQKETIEYILEKLGDYKRFSSRAMFGEYALYADPRHGGASRKVVALVCDDLLYVKILPASSELENICEKDAPYEGAKLHYVVEEEQLSTIENLPDILFAIAESIPEKKVKKKKK
ncbi:transcriptional regulator [Candidatus Nomurabacteria bacterium]|nr:transcriptional regulator [Candidatus Nomurabacteria bacterium]